MKIIFLQNVTMKYDQITALNNISLEIDDGEMIALIGANGAGKSSLIKILTGAVQPTEGKVLVDEKSISAYSEISWSPQWQVIDWYLNVKNNVLIGTLLTEKNFKQAEIKALEALKIMKIDGKEKKMLDELSGGQQQRVQVARAIAHSSKLMLLDEPTVGLDADSTDNLLKYLKNESEKGKSVIVSSHDLSAIERFCTKILYLDKGNIMFYGNKEEFYQIFSSETVIEFELDNELENETIKYLEQEYIIKSLMPLQIIVKENQEIWHAVKFIEEKSVIKNIKFINKNLRQVYLEVNK